MRGEPKPLVLIPTNEPTLFQNSLHFLFMARHKSPNTMPLGRLAPEKVTHAIKINTLYDTLSLSTNKIYCANEFISFVGHK